MDLKQKALNFARAAHGAINQKRKYSNEDYIVHPIEVAGIVASVGGSDEMVAAAYLHDVVEDTGVSIDTIQLEFGSVVCSLVSDLTDVSKKEDGNRRTRKAIDLKHTAGASPEAKTIKLADLISNTRSIVHNDPGFARVYLREKKALLEVLKDGNKNLYSQAETLLRESLKILNESGSK